MKAIKNLLEADSPIDPKDNAKVQQQNCKNWNSAIFVVTLHPLKFKLVALFSVVKFCLEKTNADEMTNSADPDQTATFSFCLTMCQQCSNCCNFNSYEQGRTQGQIN